MAKGAVPFDAKAATDSIAVALSVSKLPYTAFVAGSDKGDTRADPKVWSEADKFAELAAQMQDELAKLPVATKSGSLDAVRSAVGDTGKSCKTCHDMYRRE
jgi:cytochrome c556